MENLDLNLTSAGCFVLGVYVLSIVTLDGDLPIIAKFFLELRWWWLWHVWYDLTVLGKVLFWLLAGALLSLIVLVVNVTLLHYGLLPGQPVPLP